MVPRRAAAMIDLAKEIEDKAWSSPGGSDTRLPYGLPYWIVKNSTTGFNGGAPSGHTTVGGVSLTDSPNFKNYTVTYTDVTKADLIKKLRTMARKINFKSPVDIPEYRGGKSRQHLYVNEATITDIETLGEQQNENLGRDIASMDGKLVFHGNPIVYVPKLDSDTSNPVYMVDHQTFYPVCLKGDYLRETKNMAPNQHNITQYFVDLTYNFLCVDRRRNGVAYIA
jgi:hypothetical protein